MAIELKKVTLENRGDSHRIILSKETQKSNQEIIINLNISLNFSLILILLSDLKIFVLFNKKYTSLAIFFKIKDS